MAETWPSGLQQFLNENGFGYETGTTSIRTENEIGPAKVRRIMTKSTDSMTCSINVTTAQYAILNHFYDITLNGGVKSFNFVHPLEGTLAEFRMVEPPSYRSIGGGNFIASMRWEKLP